MSSEPRRLAVIAAAVAGLGLVLLPWLQVDQPMPLPAAIEPGSAHEQLLRSTVQAVDAACRRGDVAGYRTWVTEAHAEVQQACLQQLGRELDAAALRQAAADGGLAGRLGDKACLFGRAAGSRACVVFASHDEVRAGHARSSSLAALRFEWDGARFRLDAVQPRRLPAGADAVASATGMGEALLRRR